MYRFAEGTNIRRQVDGYTVVSRVDKNQVRSDPRQRTTEKGEGRIKTPETDHPAGNIPHPRTWDTPDHATAARSTDSTPCACVVHARAPHPPHDADSTRSDR